MLVFIKARFRAVLKLSSRFPKTPDKTMEKLNEYLQTLLSTCSYELHLEPNKNPYIVSANGSMDVANAPLLGTQISTLVFPLIPNAVKMELPNKNEIEFTHTHNLGNFNFQVRKSPAGFNVTIRPIINDASEGGIDLIQIEPDMFSQPAPVASFSNEINQAAPEAEKYSIESSSIVYENETSAIQTNYLAPELEAFWAPHLDGTPTLIVVGAPLFLRMQGSYFRIALVILWL